MNTGKFRVSVVGGGTAGWLSALIIKNEAGLQGLSVELTVVESSKIPTIGVGEGTTAVFHSLLEFLGIDELEFLRETGATFKYGIRHRDWREIGHTYDGPIDDPQWLLANPSGATSSWLNQYCVASGRPVSDPHLFTYLMDRSRAPFVLRKGKKPLSISQYLYAFHFDQSLVGRFLRSKAEGITHLDATVETAKLDSETGLITSLVLDDGREVPVDFVIDCTGFRRELIGKLMGADWISFAESLPVNRAMPFWLDFDEDGEIPAHTLAWALGSGWMWQIPTQGRLGCGYVYSDRFLSPDEAHAEVEAVLERKIEPRADIRIDSGRLDRAWIGNCLATGLAQSFFEPLEATSIHGTIVQMLIFAEHHLKSAAAGSFDGRDEYNRIAARQVEDFRRFINLHYVSRRRDTPFWQHVANDCIGDDVREQLSRWSRRLPVRDDFELFVPGFPHVEEQLHYPVLDGLGLLDREVAKQELAKDPRLRAHARKVANSLKKEFRVAATRATGHREFLRSIGGCA